MSKKVELTEKDVLRGGIAYGGFEKMIEQAKTATKNKFYLEAIVIYWSVIESFLVPDIINRMLLIYKIPLAKGCWRAAWNNFEIFLLLTHEESLYSRLIQHHKKRNEIIHDCCDLSSFKLQAYEEKQRIFYKELKATKKLIEDLSELLGSKGRKPKSLQVLDETYRKGAEDFRKSVIEMLESKIEESNKTMLIK